MQEKKRRNHGWNKTRAAFKHWIAAVLLAALAAGAMPCIRAQAADANLDLYARGAVLMDAASGRVLYGKEEDVALPMASTTKLMTCILALELGNLEDEVVASAYAASQIAVHLGMTAGESFTLRDLLYSLMLESHNDSAVAIAEHVGGSVEAFAAMMNAKAREIGCLDTHYITPNGLDAVETIDGVEVRHSTTARDLARVMRYCIMLSPKKDLFLEITRTPNYSFSNRQGSRTFSCSNHNAFLNMMEGALTGKTGFTSGAGYCYVGAVRRDDRTFIVALLASGWPNHRTYKWTDTTKLMEYGINNYFYKDIYREIPLHPIRVVEGVPAGKRFDHYSEVTVPVEAQATQTDDGTALYFLLSPEDEVKIDVYYAQELEAPARKGTAVGRIVYRINGEPVKEYKIVLAEDVRRKDLIYVGKYILQEFLLAG